MNNNDNKKTILLIGRTGNGKSTLANVLLGMRDENKDFKKVFGEGDSAVSETRKIQSEEFTEDGISYRIVDTIGIGDTNMTLDKMLRKLALMSYEVRDGLFQILFVTDGRVTRESKLTYDLLKKVVFDDEALNFTTVVRTNFSGFQSDQRCKNEKEVMKKNEELKSLIEGCKDRIIFVDNPSVDGDDEEKKINITRREISREKALSHFTLDLKIAYKPKNLNSLNESIKDHMAKKKILKANDKKEKDPEKKNKNVFKKVWSGLEEKFEKLENIKDNSSLNKEITKKMLRHIGTIDNNLKKKIEEQLKNLKKGKNTASDISISEEIADLQALHLVEVSSSS